VTETLVRWIVHLTISRTMREYLKAVIEGFWL
jgi:hypothetical protein